LEFLSASPGSRRSGGFSVTSVELLANSVFSAVLSENPQLTEFQIAEGAATEIRGKTYCWVKMNRDGSIFVPEETLKKYGLPLATGFSR
jgi:hypothetical protein